MTNTLRTLLLGAGLALLSSSAFAAPAVTVAEAGFATGPGMDYDTRGSLPVGTHVDVVWCGTHDSWCLVNVHNKMGWVPLSILNFKVGSKGGIIIGTDGKPVQGPAGNPGTEHATASISDEAAAEPSGPKKPVFVKASPVVTKFLPKF